MCFVRRVLAIFRHAEIYKNCALCLLSSPRFITKSTTVEFNSIKASQLILYSDSSFLYSQTSIKERNILPFIDHFSNLHYVRVVLQNCFRSINPASDEIDVQTTRSIQLEIQRCCVSLQIMRQRPAMVFAQASFMYMLARTSFRPQQRCNPLQREETIARTGGSDFYPLIQLDDESEVSKRSRRQSYQS